MNSGRTFGLDLLRCLAVLFVVYWHGHTLLPDIELYSVPAFDGVTMFFVLSGFLIGGILLRTVAREDFGAAILLQFWMRRWFRTLPNYFLVLSVLAVWCYAAKLPIPDLLPYFAFSQNIAWPHPAFFGEAWSLSVEEWFYLMIPIPLYLATKLKIDRRALMLGLIIAVIAAVTAFRVWRAHHFGYSAEQWDDELRRQVVTRLDSLMYGVLGAYLSLYYRTVWKSVGRTALIVGIVMLVTDRIAREASDLYLQYWSISLGAIGVLLMLPALSAWESARGRIAQVVTFVSLISYSLYLVHNALVQWLILPEVSSVIGRVCWRCGYHPVARYLLYWTLSLALAYLLYRFFEKPVMRLRDLKFRRSGLAT